MASCSSAEWSLALVVSTAYGRFKRAATHIQTSRIPVLDCFWIADNPLARGFVQVLHGSLKDLPPPGWLFATSMNVLNAPAPLIAGLIHSLI